MIHQLIRTQHIPASLEQVWEFFATPKNLEKMTPDDLKFEITHLNADSMFQGQMIGYKIQLAPIVNLTWLTEITHIKDDSDTLRYFVDEQRTGPYKIWHHLHQFEAVDGGVLMTDEVTYLMPFGPLGEIAHALKVKSQLEGIFTQRAEFTEKWFTS